MTTYRRREHFRRGKDGRRHRVRAHTVDRGDPKGRSGPRLPSGSHGYSSLRSAMNEADDNRMLGLRYSARLARPNARCPVCGLPVFFYSNMYGSRVFFDELGPPWPKHPCTDQSQNSQHGPSSPSTPSLRPLRHVRKYAHGSAFKAVVVTADVYVQRYGQLPSLAWVVYATKRDESGLKVRLQQADRISAHRDILIIRKQLHLQIGTLVFITGSVLSFFDQFAMRPVDLPFAALDSPSWTTRLRRLFAG